MLKKYDINFKANYIKPVVIKQLKDGVYKPFEASFVKYDACNKNDLKALEFIAKTWSNFNYANSILRHTKHLHDSQDIFLLTLPQESYEKINPNKILGCSMVEALSNELEINYLQVNPKYTADKRPKFKTKCFSWFEKRFFNKKDTLFKGIGLEILNTLKEFYASQNLFCLIPASKAIKFYQKNGFERGVLYSNVWIWKRKGEKS